MVFLSWEAMEPVRAACKPPEMWPKEWKQLRNSLDTQLFERQSLGVAPYSMLAIISTTAAAVASTGTLESARSLGPKHFAGATIIVIIYDFLTVPL